jgi:DNA repair and recombination RAD54-like protein
LNAKDGLQWRPCACAYSPISPTLTIQVQKWLGDKIKPTVVTSDMKKDKISSLLKSFQNERAPGLLLISYETLLGNLALMKAKNPYGVIVCDEAHRLKNTETKVWKELITLEAKCKIMVTGTPVQNDLNEFYALLAFCMPDCLGDPKEFRKAYANPILKARDLDATDKEKERGEAADLKLRGLVSSVMLRRNNDVIAKYLPAKYELVVFCVLTDAQKQLYRQELEGAARSKAVAKADGGGTSTFKTLTNLRKLCAHPQLIADDPLHRVALGALGVLPAPSGHGGGGAVKLRSQLSGKMATLLELLLQVKKELSKS